MLKYLTHSHIRSIIMHSSAAMLPYVMFTLVSRSEGNFDDVAPSIAAVCIVSMTAFMIFHESRWIIGFVRKQSAGKSCWWCNPKRDFKLQSFSFAPVGSTPHPTASPPIGWLHRRQSHPSLLPPLSPHIRWVEPFWNIWEEVNRNETGIKKRLKNEIFLGFDSMFFGWREGEN